MDMENKLSSKSLKIIKNFSVIMHNLIGNNFFSIEDWVTFYGACFSQEQLYQVVEFPWNEDVLTSNCPLCNKTVKDCHFTFLGLDRLNNEPLTILKLQELHPRAFQTRFMSYGSDSWYYNEKFATETTMDLRWYLLHIKGVPKSENKTYNEQKAMLPRGYEVPSTVTELTKNLLIHRKTGLHMNFNRFNRCNDITSEGYQVEVGGWPYGRLDCFRGFDRSYESGVAASRKYPTKT